MTRSALESRNSEPGTRNRQQAALPLGDRPDDDASLRAAFQRLNLERVCKMNFAQFVADRTRRKSLANAGEERLRAQAKARRP